MSGHIPVTRSGGDATNLQQQGHICHLGGTGEERERGKGSGVADTDDDDGRWQTQGQTVAAIRTSDNRPSVWQRLQKKVGLMCGAEGRRKRMEEVWYAERLVLFFLLFFDYFLLIITLLLSNQIWS